MMMKTLLKSIAGLLAASATSGSAAILVHYTFNEGNNVPSTTDPNLTAGNYTPTGSVGTASFPVIYPGWAASPSSEVVGSGGVPGTEAQAVSGNDYWSFTVTPTTGYALNLSSLNFSTAFYTASGGTVTLTSWYFVRSSIDNFATTISDVYSQAHVTSGSPEFTTRNVDLTGSQYQNLTGPVTFRVYLFDNSNSTSRYIAMEDVMLDGEAVAVPEPSSFILLAGGALGLIRRRRSV